MPILYAHRGAAAELPENTLPAFLRALEVGASAIETDVHLTHDGHVVISHDPTGERAAGVRAAIRRSTLDEVRSWDVGHTFRARRGGERAASRFSMPTLAEALAALPGVSINVDVKQHDETAARAVVATVRRAKAQDRVLLTSFDTRTLGRIRELGYEGPTGLAQAEILRFLALPESALARWPLRGKAAQIPTRAGPLALDRAALIDKAHRLGLLVHYWTVDDPAEARRLLALGADGIMTDDPATIAPVFAGR